MKQGKPSETAEWVAQMRAAHQVLDAPPHVLEDPLAVRILPAEQQAELPRKKHSTHPRDSASARAFVVARSRYCEDLLARAVAAGVRQYVVLGAGLDTFAYRNPFPGLRVFEVDHPDTQAWKREHLSAAAIPIPPDVTFAPVDFATQSLAEGLAAAGFQARHPAFFCWLGVTPYITLDAFRDTLALLAARPPGSGVAFDYILAAPEMDATQRQLIGTMAKQVAKLGEPFQLSFRQEDLKAELTRAGLTDIEHLDAGQLHARYFAHRTDGLEAGEAPMGLASAWVR